MVSLEQELVKETKKQLEKLENEMQNIGYDKNNKAVKEEIVNIKAYISDCKHFLEKKELIKAFEAIVFAWGIYETLEMLEMIHKH